MVVGAPLVEGIGWIIPRKDLEPGEGGLGVVVWTGLGQFAFAVGSGGDWMEGARFLVPAMPLLAVAGVWALDGLEVRRRYGALAVLVVLGGVDTVVFSLTRSMGRPVWVRQTMTPPESVPWVEQSNQVYARDRWMANQVNRAVAALRDANDERVVVLTYQMGLIPFYVGKTHAPNLEFLDRSGLVTGHAHRCAAAQQLPRTRFGLDMSYSALFEVNSGLIEQCGWPRPELVVDLAVDPVSGEPAQAIAMTAVLEANGYDIVVVQEGQFPNGLTGRPVRHYQILGVDSALRHLLPPEWEVYSPQGE